MKILHIVNSLDCGGQEKMLIALAAALQCKGHNCLIVSIANKGDLASQAEALGLPVISLNQPYGFSLIAFFKLCCLCIKERINILHLHNGRPLIYGACVSRLLRIPSVFTRHGSGVLKVKLWILNSIKKIVAISAQARKDFLLQNPGLVRDKVEVVLNGVNVQKYSLPSTQSKSEFRIGHVARLSTEKDQETLLRAFAKFLHLFPDANIKLVIAGDGPERQKLEELAASLIITPKVEFLGFREDIPAIVNSFDVFVLSSLTEGISLTLLEAMAASKPIVATHVGGNPEVVVDGQTGFLVPPQEPHLIADKIAMLFLNPELACKMGTAGRKRVEEVFSLERMVKEYEAHYNKILAR